MSAVLVTLANLLTKRIEHESLGNKDGEQSSARSGEEQNEINTKNSTSAVYFPFGVSEESAISDDGRSQTGNSSQYKQADVEQRWSELWVQC